MSVLPQEIINKIMSFNSHPLADVFKETEFYKTYDENNTFHGTFSWFAFCHIWLNEDLKDWQETMELVSRLFEE
jgi:hypothetical protein